MEIEERDFPTLSVLSVTSGRLITEKDAEGGNGIGGLYEVLGWMTNDTPFTHQLPRFASECRPHIHALHPDIVLADANICGFCEALHGLEEHVRFQKLDELRKSMIERFGRTIKLRKIPESQHQALDPMTELLSMRKGVK